MDERLNDPCLPFQQRLSGDEVVSISEIEHLLFFKIFPNSERHRQYVCVSSHPDSNRSLSFPDWVGLP